MSFKQLIPRARAKFGDVKVLFSTNKIATYATVYISIDLLKKIGWDSNGRVFIYLDDDNKNSWMIEKVSETESGTFKLVETKGRKAGPLFSKIQFKFSEKISSEDKKIKVVDYEIIEGKIIIKGR